MLRVGLTGGLASGKSTVGAMMQARGAHLLKADELAHALMSPGQAVYDEVVKRFGREIVHSDGSIIREKLAEAAFGQNRVAELNSIVHPVVIERQFAWMDAVEREDPRGIAVVEAALILEAGVQGRFQKLVVVACPDRIKIDRYASRCTGALAEIAARKEAERRIAAQWPEAKKVAAADYIIDNSGTLGTLEEKVAGVMKQLQAAAATREG